MSDISNKSLREEVIDRMAQQHRIEIATALYPHVLGMFNRPLADDGAAREDVAKMAAKATAFFTDALLTAFAEK